MSNKFQEFTKRQITSLLEKAVKDNKIPDSKLFQFEGTYSWPFTEEQEKILLSYATVKSLTEAAPKSANTVKELANVGKNLESPMDVSLAHRHLGSPMTEPSSAQNETSPEPVETPVEGHPHKHHPRYLRPEEC